MCIFDTTLLFESTDLEETISRNGLKDSNFAVPFFLLVFVYSRFRRTIDVPLIFIISSHLSRPDLSGVII